MLSRALEEPSAMLSLAITLLRCGRQSEVRHAEFEVTPCSTASGAAAMRVSAFSRWTMLHWHSYTGVALRNTIDVLMVFERSTFTAQPSAVLSM